METLVFVVTKAIPSSLILFGLATVAVILAIPTLGWSIKYYVDVGGKLLDWTLQ